jgi:hypothetical protein
MRFYIFNRIPQSVVIRVMAYPILFYHLTDLCCYLFVKLSLPQYSLCLFVSVTYHALQSSHF